MVERVSVLIATYNRADLLPNAIDSVLAQTYPNVEIIVADDGSEDGTAEVVRKYLLPSHPFHNRVLYFRQENQGKSVALNNALTHARGEWIALLDSDDVWLPEKLERQFQVLARFPECGACFTDCSFSNNPKMNTTFFAHFGWRPYAAVGKIRNSAEFLLKHPCASIITLLCRATLLSKSGLFDPALRFTEDYDFLFRLSLATEFCYLNEPFAIADRSGGRHDGSSAVWDDLRFRLLSDQYRYEKWLHLGEQVPDRARRLIRRRLRSVHSSWANRHLEHKDYEKARRAIVDAMRYQVTPNLIAKWILTCVCPHFMTDIAQRRGLRSVPPE